MAKRTLADAEIELAQVKSTMAGANSAAQRARDELGGCRREISELKGTIHELSAQNNRIAVGWLKNLPKEVGLQLDCGRIGKFDCRVCRIVSGILMLRS